MTTQNLTLLDCTLRDGGYYNKWNFKTELVEKYLRAVAHSGIDVAEIGFRFFPKNEFLGPYAYSTDAFLRTITLPAGVRIAVMSNAKDLIKHEAGPRAAVDLLYNPAEESPVSIVRLAVNVEEAALARPAEAGPFPE